MGKKRLCKQVHRTAATMGMAALLLLGAGSALAQVALLKGPRGAVTPLEVTTDAAARIPENIRSTVLARPNSVEDIASNVYLQRAMAQEAISKGLDKDKEAEISLTLAREKALADLYLADLEKRNMPTDKALDDYALATYKTMGAEKLQAPDRVGLAQILIKGNTQESLNKAEELLAQLRTGANFAQLAKLQSEDTASASKGGFIGFVTEKDMTPLLVPAVKALEKPGDLSPVTSSPAGMHILRLVERRPAGKRDFDEMREQLRLQARSTLLRDARQKNAQTLLKDTQPNEAAIASFAEQYAK